jgi:hypothetical protein
VSDVTAEEVERERPRAHLLSRACQDYWTIARGVHLQNCTTIATALAVRAREARREALERAEKIAYDAAQKAEDAQGYYGPAAAEADAIADAIRALMGPES